MVKAIFLTMALLFSGCKSTYQFGDISKRINNISYNYCNEDNPEARAMLKMTLNSMGVNIGFDYCTAYTVKTILIGN